MGDGLPDNWLCRWIDGTATGRKQGYFIEEIKLTLSEQMTTRCSCDHILSPDIRRYAILMATYTGVIN